ncbi:MAG: hypothetical protein JXA60_02980 [Candidatus Coatesbacteria bacterium]|nr:hypothetical protein [Candidatus Coatesbacteria bacterium]
MKSAIFILLFFSGIAFSIGIEDYLLLGDFSYTPSIENNGKYMKMLDISASFSIIQQSEDRSSVVYDSYDNRMGENTFATSTKMWLRPKNIDAAYRVYGSENSANIYAGISVNRIWQGAYRAIEYQRDASYQVTSSREWIMTGDLYQNGLLLYAKANQYVDIELKPGYVMGTLTKTYHYMQTGEDEQTFEDAYKAKGIAVNAVINGHLNNAFHARLGYFLAPLKAEWTKKEPNRTDTVLSDQTFKLPAKASFTLIYSPASYFKSSLDVGADYVFYKNYEFPGKTTADSLKNALVARMGVTHFFNEIFNARAGLSFAKSPLCSALDRININIGGHIAVNKNIGLSLEYGHSFQSFEYGDISGYMPDLYEADEEINFTGNGGNINFSLNYSL